MKVHHLKCHARFFLNIINGIKPFEIRTNDRDFQVGDVLVQHETDDNGENPTGSWVRQSVLYVTDFMQQPGVVVMGVQMTKWGKTE